MKRLTIASAATLLALGALQAPIAQAQSAATTGDATSTTPGVTGQPAPTPGSIPPAGATPTAPGSQAAGSPAPGSQAPGATGTMQRDANLGTTPQTTNRGPQKGANSFTEGQAQGRITDAGFTSVAGLKKDSDGIWRGNAMKNGQTVGVWLDYTGNVGQS